MYNLVRKNRKKSGFTLIELLVVVAIIGILAAIALPKLFSAICKAKVGQAHGVFGSINGALSMYFSDLYTYPKEAAAVTVQSMSYFHPGYMNVPKSPWSTAGAEYKYSSDASIYTLGVQVDAGKGCNGTTGTGGDDYQYYSSFIGTVSQTTTALP